MSRPDFIIIGAMKCGTSTLAAQLGAQDGIFMTDPKEPNYFSDDAVFAKGPAWYEALFSKAATDEIRGEASTHYTKLPNHPATLVRMTAVLPKVRLIYMIRNPMTRLVSHYIHEWSQGVFSGSLAETLPHTPELVNYGRYGWQIAPFVKAYGRESVLLTSLERLTADPQSELTRIARYVGHRGPVTWKASLATQNVSAERARRLPMHDLLVDNPVATVLRRTFVPKSLRSRIRAGLQMKDRPEIPATMKTALEARFADDRSVLSDIFPGDPTLNLAYPFLK